MANTTTQESPITITAASDLEANRRVKIGSGNTWSYAGAGEDHDAITLRFIASGLAGPALLRTHAGTVKLTAAGAIAIGALCYPAANGKVSATQAGQAVARNRGTATTADGDATEAIQLPRDGGIFKTQVTCAANQTDVDTGFGANPALVVAVVRTSAGVERVNSGNTITYPSAGTVRVANASMVNTDILTLIAYRTVG